MADISAATLPSQIMPENGILDTHTCLNTYTHKQGNRRPGEEQRQNATAKHAKQTHGQGNERGLPAQDKPQTQKYKQTQKTQEPLVTRPRSMTDTNPMLTTYVSVQKRNRFRKNENKTSVFHILPE